jgi:hypothetical protein
MREVHEGICGTHQSAHRMKWLLRRAGFYWLTMLNDYFRYYKGCESCQKFGDVQLALAAMLHPIIKPWPFCGWALDFIGQIHHASYFRSSIYVSHYGLLHQMDRGCPIEEHDA